MKNYQFKVQAIILLSILLLSNGAGSDIAPKGSDDGVLQFDGIIELNAPHFQTHVLLFVRYWVSTKFYSASIVWAEPHVGSLNFPIYPITTVIDSNEKSFRINNKVNTNYNSTFSKPLGNRDVFRFMFNDYPIGNIRFAESDALESRIYTDDLGRLPQQDVNDRQLIDINKSAVKNGTQRNVTKIDLKANDGHIVTLKLLDSKDRLIKSIDYDYITQNGTYLLHKQNVLLPERPLTVGYKSGGVTMTINGKKQVINELKTVHHAGSRKCIVDYETKQIGQKTLALPVHVVVYDATGQNVLRSSRLMNFKQVDINEAKACKSADAFASFDSNEWKTRQMLLKHWMKNAAEIEAEDLVTLRQLQTHYEQAAIADKTAGERFRRTNMLLQLDWILGDGDQLQKHFQQYLALLVANDLDRMVLVGGQYAIETTFRWGHYAAADQMLVKWIDTAVANNDEQSILSFGQSAVRRGRFWTIAGLMEKSLASSKKWGQKRFEAESLKCLALFGLYEMLQNPDKIPKGTKKAQADWVLSSTNINRIQDSLKQSIAEAQETFAELKDPTPDQKSLKKQLDGISTKKV